jgi:fibronectin-binding autotransporter adhesin
MPTYSAITTTPLSDALTLFINENVITNSSNSTRGTGTYLGDGWVLTAQHVIQNGSDYNTLAQPGQLTMSVSANGTSHTYTADMVSTEGSPASGPDIAMIHLAGASSGPLAMLPGVLKSAIYTGGSEAGQLVQLGGYGWYGQLGSTTLSEDASFHRAFNVVSSLSGDKANVPANASSRLVNDGYVLGIGQPGDSGSGLWMDNSTDSDTNLWDYYLIGALDTTSNGAAFGSNNQYARVSSHQSWILNTAYAAHNTVTWDISASSGIQEGNGTWDLSAANFGNGVNNFAWDNSTTQNANFGAHKGVAGTVTLGANVNVQNMMFNPAASGSYTIAGNGSFAITIANNGMITSHADAAINATIAGAGTINKVGPSMLAMGGSNSFVGTIALGVGATSGGNLNGALRITNGNAIAHITVYNSDNNTAYDIFQIDGSAGNVTAPNTAALVWNANFAGPAATAANVIENIGGDNVLNPTVTYQSGGIGYGILSDAGTLTFAGDLNANGTTGKTFYLRGPGNGAFTGLLTGSGAAINQTSTGMWTLNSANSFTGSVTIAGGILSTNRFGNGGAASGIGESSNAASSLILTGGTLRYTGSGASIDRLFTVGPGGGSIDASGTGSLVFNQVGGITSSDAIGHNGVTTTGSNIVTITSAGMTDLAAGMTVTGSGIPAATTITAINPDTGTIALSNNATISNTAGLSFGTVNRTLTLTGSNAAANALTPSLANSSTRGKLALTKAGSGEWVLNSANTYTGDTNISNGTLIIASTSSITSPNVNVTSGATLTVNGTLSTSTALTSNGFTSLAPITSGSSPHVRTLGVATLGASGTILFAPGASPANSNLLSIGSVNFAGTPTTPLGLLDMGNSDAIIRNTPVTDIAGEIASAYNNGSWNGSGIGSAMAQAIAADNSNLHKIALGYAAASDLNVGSFDGQAVSGSQVLVKYTWSGDANLDGVVNSLDLNALATNFGASNPLWDQGDFNYGGSVGIDDFNLLAMNFGQTAPLSSLPLGALVPEPASLALLALITCSLKRSRRVGGQ